MGIRITDQPADQHAQNPPPEHDAGLDQAQSKAVSSFVAGPIDNAPVVLRGAGVPHAFTFVQQVELSTAPTAPAEDASRATITLGESDAVAGPIASETLMLSAAAIGWVRRDTGAIERIGTGADQQIRKLPPRWTIAPTSVSSEISAEQTFHVSKNK